MAKLKTYIKFANAFLLIMFIYSPMAYGIHGALALRPKKPNTNEIDQILSFNGFVTHLLSKYTGDENRKNIYRNEIYTLPALNQYKRSFLKKDVDVATYIIAKHFYATTIMLFNKKNHTLHKIAYDRYKLSLSIAENLPNKEDVYVDCTDQYLTASFLFEEEVDEKEAFGTAMFEEEASKEEVDEKEEYNSWLIQ